MNGWYDNQYLHSVSRYDHKLSIITHQWVMQHGHPFFSCSIFYFAFSICSLSVRLSVCLVWFVVWSKWGYSTMAITAKASLNPQIRFNQIKIVEQYATGVYSIYSTLSLVPILSVSRHRVRCLCVFVFRCLFIFFSFVVVAFNDFVLDPFRSVFASISIQIGPLVWW